MKRIGWLLALACGLALTSCGPRGDQPQSAFDGRLDDWTREILADSPELASQSGVPGDATAARRLDDRSSQALEARRSGALRRLAELRALDSSKLDADDARTYAVLNAQFAGAADGAAFEYGDFSPIGGLKPYVLNQLDSAFITLPALLDERQAVGSIADAETYVARLRAVAGAIDQETQRARDDAQRGVRPPVFIIDDTLRVLDDILSQPAINQVYVTSLKRKLDALVTAENDATKKAQLQQRALSLVAQAEAITRDQILPAHQRAAQWLRADRPNATEDAGVWRLPQGDAFYAATLRIETTTDLTPDQIHRIGLDRVRALSTQLDIALRRIGLTEGPVGQRMTQMTADPRYRYEDSDAGRAQLIADVNARVQGVMQRAPQWFGVLPKAKLEVRRVPLFAESSQPGAYYSAPSMDGTSPGVYYVNLRDLGEMTKIDLPTQDFHEAVPGHHFQIALAQEQSNTPLLRRLISFNAYSEGWGLYAEELADEQGFYDRDPVGRIGYLRWQLWRAARLVVDTGIHAKRWTRQQAIDYLVQTTGDAPGVITTEVDRYVTWPGQACGYELGRREIERLREQARNELGPDFDLRGFHDAVLLGGEVPLTVLDQVVRDWIPEQRKKAEHERNRR